MVALPFVIRYNTIRRRSMISWMEDGPRVAALEETNRRIAARGF
jgi:hypothetical protein